MIRFVVDAHPLFWIYSARFIHFHTDIWHATLFFHNMGDDLCWMLCNNGVWAIEHPDGHRASY